MSFRLLRHSVAAAAVAVALVLPASAVANAADASGCSGEAVSDNGASAIVDTMVAPGPGGSKDDPFQVDTNGSVAWKGKTAGVITNGSWSVTIMGIPFRSGTFDNGEGKTSSSGVQDLSELPAPVKWFLMGSARIPVSGEVTGSGGTCTASFYISGSGSATGSPLFIGGIAMVFLGLLGLFAMVSGTKVVGVVAAPPPPAAPGPGVPL